MKYQFFLDETGDHGLSYIDKNFPLFLLCGCLFEDGELEKTEDKIKAFKLKYFKTTDVILHSRKIRRCEYAFQILFDLDLKASFYSDLNQLLRNAKYTIIGSAINKEKHIKLYGKQAKDPYSISISFLIERLIFCLDSMDKNAKVDIKVESRGKREDDMLLAHFNSILDGGTYYVSRDRLRNKITSFKFCNKQENLIGLQVADLSAYPLARHLLSPTVPYIPFDVIRDKIYRNKKGEYDGWGLKVFP